ncbi:MAG: TonB-dependent siderophore receptor [Shinella sp.]|nr:TonB-dependent siderophore receptor [Shinella sp.]
MSKSRRTRLYGVLMGGTALLAAPLALAQQNATELEAIVVTGQENGSGASATGPVDGYVAERTATGSKSNTPIEEIPQSVSVMGREEMDDLGAKKIDEALRYSPGVFAQPFGPDGDTNWLYIRGFDATQSGTYLDGLQNFSYGFGGFFIDSDGLERIEVLRGAASVLYGGANAGGIVNYISKRPTGERIREAGVGIDSYGNGYFNFDIGDKASETLDYRINGKLAGGDKYTDFAEDFRGTLSPSFTWRPDDTTSLTILANYTYIDLTHDGAGFLPYYGTVVDAPFGKISREFNSTEPDIDYYYRRQASIGYEFEHTFDNNWTFRQNFRYGHSNVEEHSLYTYGYGFLEQPAGTDYSLSRINFAHSTTVDTVLLDNQLEGTVQTGPVEHRLLFGAEYKYFRIDHVQATGAATPIDPTDPIYGLPQGPMFDPYIDQVLSRNQFGVYAQDQMRFGDGWIVTLNGRYDYVETKSSGLAGGSTAGYTFDDSRASGRAGIGYEFANGITPYASVATFFNPVIDTLSNGDPAASETGQQYEVGIKYKPQAFDGLITAAFFDLTKENVILGDGITIPRTQLGEVNSRGFEFEAQANITEAWKVAAAFTAYNLKITDDEEESLIGKRPYLIPETQASLFAQYTFQEDTALEGVSVGAGVRYIGSSFADRANELEVPSVTLVDLKVGYQKNNWGVDFNVTNLFDKEYVAGCQTSLNCGYGEGRKALLSAHVKW